jgi:ATP-dependent exoDNAse (exonuclease V) beta subunit
MTIRFISAGAGSGKTYRLTELMSDRLAQQQVRPEAVMAMTFTRKAAGELSERVRQRLIEDGHYAYANSMGQALIGTVNSVCGKLLQRYAFEAGLSPQLEVIAEALQPVLLAQALEQAMTQQDMREMNALARRLGLSEWQKEIKQIVDLARANDTQADALAFHAQRSTNELLAYFPAPLTEDLNKHLRDALAQAISGIAGNGDETKTTRSYLDLLEGVQHRLRHGKIQWNDWVNLSNKAPGKSSKQDAEVVMEIAQNYDRHPQLHRDIGEWTERLFDLASRALDNYQSLKAERGLMDFVDQERLLLKLLDLPEVVSSIEQELDLLLVDEFQDTSPIQLALFLKLADLAGECIWVGDIKQAIYGFRGTDPELMNAVVDNLKQSGIPVDILPSSWRSRPALVELANALFVPAFSEYLNEEQVRLRPERKEQLADVPLQFWNWEGSNEEKRAASLAKGVIGLLESGVQIVDKETNKPRALLPGDIAILSRMNSKAVKYAEALSTRGQSVTLEQPGLLETPEVHLAMACLRFLVDQDDSLARAEVIALKTSGSPETWLENRLEYLAEENPVRRWGVDGKFQEPALIALDTIRDRLQFLSPSEALDEALITADVRRDAIAWGPTKGRSTQRLANLETLRGYATDYENDCLTQRVSATVGGFLLWFNDLAKAKLDKRGADSQIDAVRVLTHHGAKGLEWPVVIAADLESNIRSDLWSLSVQSDNNTLDIHGPLANRWLRYWPWPFGGLSANIAIKKKIEESDAGQVEAHKQVNEAVRLLYVSFTRARDLVILPLQSKTTDRPWLETLGANWLSPQESELQLPNGGTVSCATKVLDVPETAEALEPDAEQMWFPTADALTPKLPAHVRPSSQLSLESASIGSIIDVGSRLTLKGKPESGILGNALHNILAADLIDPEHAGRREVIEGILRRHGLTNSLQSDEVAAYAAGFYRRLVEEFKPLKVLPEWPLTLVLDNGQRMHGWIDLLLETPEGYIIIDHKSFPGGRRDWSQKALSYSGQLAAYREAVLKATQRPVISQWIHFSVGGGLVEVVFNGE